MWASARDIWPRSRHRLDAATPLAVAGCVLWPVMLGELTRRRFGWEPRSTA